MIHSTRVLALALSAAVAGAPGGASADTDSVATPEMMQEARTHFATGKAAFQRGEYGPAKTEYEKAYALLPLPEFLRSLTQAAGKQGQLDEAIRYGEKYLATSPADSDAREMNEYLAELRAQKEKAPPAVPAPTAVASPRPSLLGPLLVVGSGALLLAVGGGLGIGAISAQQSFSDATSNGSAFWLDVQGTYNQGAALGTAAIALDVIGGTVLAAGVAWTGYAAYQRRHRGAAPSGSDEKRADQGR